MATVKTQGGKVILKDGKVSCSCCEEPVECCMYPARGFADGLFSSGDLPSSVIIDGIIFSVSGTSYGNTINGVILEGSVWAKYTNGSRSTRPCLLQGGVEDQFADTYLVSATNSVNPDQSFSGRPVTRQSLCLWTGSNGTSLVYQPIFSQFGQSQKDRWQISFQGIDGTFAASDRLITPVGAYDNRFNFSDIAVS